MYLARIIRDVNDITKKSQWRNTYTVINWFQNITNKNNCRFIRSDMSEFYATISGELLEKAVRFAKSMTNIDDGVVQIV